MAAPPVTVSTDTPFGGLALAGGGAVWGASYQTATGPGFAVRAATLDGRLATLLADPEGRGSGGGDFGPDIAGSASRVAVYYAGGEYLNSPGKSFFSTPGGFEAFGDGCPHMKLDLDGELLAYACGGGYASVRDLSTGEIVGNSDKAVRDVGVAGRYMAWVEPWTGQGLEVVVHDRITGRDVYRIDVKALLPPADFSYVKFDLTSDGRLVAAYNNFGSPSTLAWFSPAEPYAHVIADGIVDGPAVAGELIAVKRKVPGSDTEFAVIDFAGATVQAFERDDPRYGTRGLAFDGSLLTWQSHRHGIRMSRFPVEPAPVAGPPLPIGVATRFSLAPRRFRAVGRRGASERTRASRSAGTLLRLGLRRRARVTIRIERRVNGLMRRGSCRAGGEPRAGGGRCVVHRSVGALRLGRRQGLVRRRFGGRIGGRALCPGRYRAVALTSFGRARAVRDRVTAFTILPPR